MRRALATARIKRGAFPFHLVLLQLDHDASFTAHGPFATMTDFLATVLEGFARNAPPHHHLVFKAHPLEDGRAEIASSLRKLAAAHGVSARVHYVEGGKLAHLLGAARSAITVNSTAAQQALWRGLPVKVFGDAVYGKQSLVSFQSLATFFQDPQPPDADDYRAFRTFLLETSQRGGGYYSAKGRRALLRQLPDLMLAEDDPYTALKKARAPAEPRLRTVSQSAQSGQTM
jgi:capsular polysaccharide export protein